VVRFRLPRHRFDRELLFGGGPFEFAEPCWYFTDSNLVRPAVLRVISTSESPDAGRNSSFGSYQTHDTPLLQVFDEFRPSYSWNSCMAAIAFGLARLLLGREFQDLSIEKREVRLVPVQPVPLLPCEFSKDSQPL